MNGIRGTWRDRCCISTSVSLVQKSICHQKLCRTAADWPVSFAFTRLSCAWVLRGIKKSAIGLGVWCYYSIRQLWLWSRVTVSWFPFFKGVVEYSWWNGNSYRVRGWSSTLATDLTGFCPFTMVYSVYRMKMISLIRFTAGFLQCPVVGLPIRQTVGSSPNSCIKARVCGLKPQTLDSLPNAWNECKFSFSCTHHITPQRDSACRGGFRVITGVLWGHQV